MDPRHFSPKTKRQAYTRSKGHCEKCTAKLTTGNIIYDHIIAWEIARNSSLDNCQVLCRNCDASKTYGSDIPTIAKVHRLFDGAHGIERPKQRLPGGRGSKWKKKITGEVVLRYPEERA